MLAKFAYFSSDNPKHDYIFSLNAQDEDEAYFIADDLNSNLSDGHVEFICMVKTKGKHERS